MNKSCRTCEGMGRVLILPTRGVRINSATKMFMDCPTCRPDNANQQIIALTSQLHRTRVWCGVALLILLGWGGLGYAVFQ